MTLTYAYSIYTLERHVRRWLQKYKCKITKWNRPLAVALSDLPTWSHHMAIQLFWPLGLAERRLLPLRVQKPPGVNLFAESPVSCSHVPLRGGFSGSPEKLGTVRGICSYQSTNYLFVTLFFQIPLCGNIERCLGFSVNRRWLKRMDHWGNKSCTEAFGIIHILYYLIRLLGWIIFYIMYTCSGHSMPLELWYE
jgi:hypothetical protein